MKISARDLRTGQNLNPDLLDTIPLTDGSGRRMVTYDVHRAQRDSLDADGKDKTGNVVAVPVPVNVALYNPSSGQLDSQPGYDVMIESD